MSRGRVPGLALAIVLPAALLAGGWLWASGRGLERREAGLRQQLLRATDAVRAAAVASLAELREREDERPFYLYNRYYSPPEVLAVSDPVALSPLARGPGDARGVAHFQLDPEGSGFANLRLALRGCVASHVRDFVHARSEVSGKRHLMLQVTSYSLHIRITSCKLQVAQNAQRGKREAQPARLR